ncbi:MAG: sensor histidine kinase [Planctomycetota bacterium]
MGKREADEAREQDRLASIGRHVGYLLHQVRSPVVTMGLLARSVRRRAELEDAQREKIDQIIDQASKVEEMLNHCLDYLRPTQAGAERVNVPNLVEWVSDELGPEADQAQVTLELDLCEGLPVIFGHRRMLREALLNVVRNAVEAASDSEGHVTVKARAEGDQLILEVEDDGGGVPREVVEEAFEPFVTTKDSGTGLGLALARKVVEGHRGAIDIESEEAQGTRVRMQLPIEGRGRGRAREARSS